MVVVLRRRVEAEGPKGEKAPKPELTGAYDITASAKHDELAGTLHSANRHLCGALAKYTLLHRKRQHTSDTGPLRLYEFVQVHMYIVTRIQAAIGGERVDSHSMTGTVSDHASTRTRRECRRFMSVRRQPALDHVLISGT